MNQGQEQAILKKYRNPLYSDGYTPTWHQLLSVIACDGLANPPAYISWIDMEHAWGSGYYLNTKKDFVQNLIKKTLPEYDIEEGIFIFDFQDVIWPLWELIEIRLYEENLKQ